MKEGEPQPLPEPIPIDKARKRRGPKRGKERWDIDLLAFHLKTQPVPVQDPELGAGSRLVMGLGNPPVTALELFPEKSAARVFCQGLRIEVSQIAPVLPDAEVPSDEESISLINRTNGNDLRLGFSAQGDVSLFIAPHQALEAEPSTRALPSSGDEETAEQSREKEGQTRVAIQGRLGADPTFRTSAKGTLIARFPLAERQEEATLWHQVLAFGTLAEQHREALKKGQSIEVIGYLHERPAKNKPDRMVQEIYAALIRTQRSDR